MACNQADRTGLIDGKFPGCLYLLSSWYTRKELTTRTAVLYSGSVLSGAFSGLIAAGITKNLGGAMGLGAWQWLFIIEGVITVSAKSQWPPGPGQDPHLTYQNADLRGDLCLLYHS